MSTNLEIPAQSPIILYRRRGEGVAKLWRALLRDRVAFIAFIFFSLVILVSLLAPVISPYDYSAGNVMERLMPPVWSDGGSWSHVLGTDQQGRDVLSRLFWGGRVSLRVGFIVVIISGVIGTALGLIAGYSGGAVDNLIMRLVDIMFSLPGMLVALVFVMVLGPGERNLIIALTVNGWMVHTRLARGLVLTMRDGPLVEAARTVGSPTSRILLRHIMPNVAAPIITLYVLEVARIMLAEASMSFLGYGIQPPTSSWGLMIGQGRAYVTADPWLAAIPGVVLSLTVLTLNVIANWFRTETDPLQKTIQQANM